MQRTEIAGQHVCGQPGLFRSVHDDFAVPHVHGVHVQRRRLGVWSFSLRALRGHRFRDWPVQHLHHGSHFSGSLQRHRARNERNSNDDR